MRARPMADTSARCPLYYAAPGFSGRTPPFLEAARRGARRAAELAAEDAPPRGGGGARSEEVLAPHKRLRGMLQRVRA